MTGRWRRGKPQQPPADLFGLQGEALILATKAREVFTPFQPLQRREMLVGRVSEVQAAVGALTTPGRHVVLCGPPSSGRTSLATVIAAVMSDAMTISHIVKRCDQGDTFESVVERPLAAVGVDVHRIESTVQHAQTLKGELAVGDVGVGRERQFTRAAVYRPDGKVGAAEAAEHLRGSTGVFVVDGVEVLSNPECAAKLATLVKHLSDARSPYKMIMTGTPDTVRALVEGYPPVRHCLKTVRVPLLQAHDLVELVKIGAALVGQVFADEVVAEIARLSAGYAHFTHLLALRCVETAIREGRNAINEADLRYATAVAMEDMDEQLTTAFLNVVGDDLDPHIVATLKSAAAHDTTEFPHDHTLPVLEQVRPGIHQFKDGRLKAYLRIRYPFDR